MSPDPNSHRPPMAAILLIPVIVALVLTLFAWPNARLEPRDLPIGVAGPPVAAKAFEQRLVAQEGAFEVKQYANEAEARAAIEDRDVYGAFVATPAGAKVLIASAASQLVSQLLTRAAEESGPGGAPVEDVVSASPRSAALAASVLPLVLAGIVTGALCAAITADAARRVGLVIAGSILAGLAAALIVQSWLDVIEGDWLGNWAAFSLTVLAIAAVVAGLEALIGAAGAIIAALVMVLIGNPFSGVGTAPEMLPEPVGGIGQLLPPGAGGNLVRSTGFFDGAGATGHITVLVIWSLAGLACLFLAGMRGWRPAPRPAGVQPS